MRFVAIIDFTPGCVVELSFGNGAIIGASRNGVNPLIDLMDMAMMMLRSREVGGMFAGGAG